SPDTTHLPHPRSNALRQARSTRRTQQHGSSILPPGCSGDLVGRAPTCLLLLGGAAPVDRLVLEWHEDAGLGVDHPPLLLLVPQRREVEPQIVGQRLDGAVAQAGLVVPNELDKLVVLHDVTAPLVVPCSGLPPEGSPAARTRPYGTASPVCPRCTVRGCGEI